MFALNHEAPGVLPRLLTSVTSRLNCQSRRQIRRARALLGESARDTLLAAAGAGVAAASAADAGPSYTTPLCLSFPRAMVNKEPGVEGTNYPRFADDGTLGVCLFGR